jgi:hypothetical protein
MSAWLKHISHNCSIALAAPMVLLVASLPVSAQDQQGQPQSQQQPQQQPEPLTQQQVQQLVAPIALYPDAFVGTGVDRIDLSARSNIGGTVG